MFSISTPRAASFWGYDEFGREQFDTWRTEVGELLYRLKYRNDPSALDEIGVICENFIRSWLIEFDIIRANVAPDRIRSTTSSTRLPATARVLTASAPSTH